MFLARDFTALLSLFISCTHFFVLIKCDIISTIAGTGMADYQGDGGAATAAKVNYPNGVVLDSSGNVFIADVSNNRIRKIAISNGIISTYAGSGSYGYSGDGGSATAATLSYPMGIAFDLTGNCYFNIQFDNIQFSHYNFHESCREYVRS